MYPDKQKGFIHSWHWLMTLFSLLVLAAYWVSLEQSYRYMQQAALEQTRLRAERQSKASAAQMETVMQGLDFSLRSMANNYLHDGIPGLQVAAQTVLAAYPPDSIVQIAMADSSGQLRYSNLDAQARLSIADREHFRIHLRQPGDKLYISPPLLGRLSQRRVIQLSRPVIDNGRLAGVLVLSLNPDYLARLLNNSALRQGGVISLLHRDGSLLASAGDRNVMPATLPPLPPDSAASHGQLDEPPGSKKRHLYAWQRLPENGLLIVTALDTQIALAPANDDISDSRRNGLLGSILFLALVQGIAILLQRQSRQRRQMQAIYTALPVGVLLTDEQFRIREGNLRAAELLGCESATLAGQYLDGLLQLPAGQALQQAQPVVSHYACRKLELLLTPPRQSPRWLGIRISLSHISGSHYLVTVSDISERHFSHIRLEESEERLALALQDADLSLWDLDIRSMQMWLGPMSSAIIGLPPQEQITPFALWKSRIHPQDTARQQQAQAQHLQGETADYACRYRVRHQDGHWVWIQSHGKVVQRDHNGQALRMLGTHRDISSQIEAEQLKNQWQQQLEKLTTLVPGVIYQYQLRADGSDCFPYCSPGIRDIYDLNPADIRDDGSAVFALIHPDDTEMLRQSILQSAQTLENWEQEYRVQRPDGHAIWLHGQSKPERQGDGSTLWHGYFYDITRHKEAETRLRYLATTDPLTGLANRRDFTQRADAELALCRRHAGHDSSLIMLDIDFFKHVNDSYGHATGDLVLQQLAALLKASLRSSDVAGRLGGEEFAILLPDTGPDGALQYAERLRRQIENYPFGNSDQPFRVTASMGISALAASDSQLDAALARADKALYQAKSSGRNRVCHHSTPPPQPA